MISLFLALALPAAAAPRLEVLLNAPMAKTAGLSSLSGALAVTPDRRVLLGEGDGAVLLGWGGLAAVEGMGRLDAMAYTDDGRLMAIRGRELVIADGRGAFKTLFTLPSGGMGLAAGKPGRMLLFERLAGRSALYELRPGKKLAKLLESPEPIGGAAQAADGRLVLSAGGALFEAFPGKTLRLLAGGGAPLVSVALGKDGRVYVSDGRAVFRLADDRLALLTKEAGGELRWLGGGLVVFDAKRPLLLRLVGF